MSIVMDSQDLRGHLRNLCLVAVLRHAGGRVGGSDFHEVLERKLGDDLTRFVTAVAAFSGGDAVDLRGAVEELYACDDEFLQRENLNLQLGLFSGRPVPVFPFITEAGVDELALLRPFIDASKNLIHSAIRLRMQALPATPAGAFWPAASRFLRRVGGDGPTAKAIAVAVIVDAASDIVFFNEDAASRTSDPILAGRIDRVLEELGKVLSEIEAPDESGSGGSQDEV